MPFRPVLAKIQLPPRPKRLLSRPRLLDFLSEHPDVKLIAISATAGYGKTSLLVDYAHRTEFPVCWYTLDRFDRDPGTFFAHFLACIRQRFPDFGQQSGAILASLQNLSHNWSTLAATVVNELYETIPEYFTVVLDDYHHIEDVGLINEFLAYLIQYSDEHCHVIVASRRLPQLPNQALLLGRGQMSGLDTGELRFTAQEIQALVKQNHRLDLPSNKAIQLTSHFDGWITGILLTTRSGWTELLGGDFQAATAGPVYGYLAEQVLADQPPELQTFLLESAVLDRMSAETLDALREADDSTKKLTQVSERNLFLIPLDDEHKWFRYHQLFQDFLQNRLRREGRDRFEALHRRAAGIFEARQEWSEAFDHYTQADDQGEMVRLLETLTEELFTTAHWDILQRWIDALSPAVAEANPLVTYCQGSLFMQQGDATSALRYYERAWHGFAKRKDTVWATWTQVRQAMALRRQGNYAESLEMGQKALSKAAALEHESLLAEAQRTVGMTYYYEGRVERAVHHLEEALQQYQVLGQAGNVAKLHHELGIAYRATGQWRKAVLHYRQAIRLWQQVNNLGYWAGTLNSVGVVHHLCGEFTQAYQALNQALEKAKAVAYRRMQALILSSLGDLHRDVGQYQEAGHVFRSSMELADAVEAGAISVYARQGLGETCRLLDDYEGAVTWLSEALIRAKAHDSAYEIGLCELARGILWKDLNRQAQAWISLGQAKEFFERSGHLHELARVYFHLAHLALQQGRRQDVARHLGIVAALSQQLGYDNFLVVEGRQAKSLLEYAITITDNGGWWASILERTAQLPASLTDEPQKTVPVRQPLRIYTLGQDRVQYGSEEAKTGRPKVRELFFYLLAHRSAGAHKEQIMVEFWPDATSSRAGLSLKGALYRLRRLYTEVRQDDHRYTPDLPDGSWYDVEAFESLLDQAQVAETDQERMDAYREALALYAGDYLEAFDAPWCTLERERLRERYRRGLHALAALHLSRGEFAESQELYRRALAADEFDEIACRGLLRSYAGAGQRPQALTLYHQFARHLYEELGIAPAAETEAIHQELLRQD
jgi:LuxR family maltose regulon positive regulatory protein